MLGVANSSSVRDDHRVFGGNQMAKILLVEDEKDLADAVKNWFEEEESNCVEHVADGEEALSKLDQRSYDLIILDLLLPRLDGMQVCKKYRDNGGTVPILMLTAKSSLASKEAGLDAGADDYLTKPFQLRELARTRALLRRQGTPRSEFRIGSLS